MKSYLATAGMVIAGAAMGAFISMEVRYPGWISKMAYGAYWWVWG